MILHTAAWAVLSCALLFYSAPTVYREVLVSKIGPIDPNRSIEPYFQGVTGIPNGPQRLGEVIERLPEGKPLVIFVRSENPQSGFLGMLVGYVCWPREVRIVEVAGPTADREVAGIRPGSVGGMAFCSVTAPSWLGKAIRLGPNILLVPLPDVI